MAVVTCYIRKKSFVRWTHQFEIGSELLNSDADPG